MHKKITILEIIIIIFVLSVLALFFSPRFMNSPQELQQATVRANVSIARSAIESVFALKANKNTTIEIAEMISETLNKTTKNPINKNNPAYTINSAQIGAIDFVTDETNDNIKINGYADDVSTPLMSLVVKRR